MAPWPNCKLDKRNMAQLSLRISVNPPSFTLFPDGARHSKNTVMFICSNSVALGRSLYLFVSICPIWKMGRVILTYLMVGL